MEHKSSALILCQKTQDEIRNNLTERIERHGIRPIYHDETSLDRDVKRVTSEIELADFMVTPAGEPPGYIHPSFMYEIGYGQSKEPIFFIPGRNGYYGLPDILAKQVKEIHMVRDPLVTLLKPGVRSFVNDILLDNIRLQMLYGKAKQSLIGY